MEAWVGRPEELPKIARDAGLQQIMADLKAGLDELCSLGDEVACRLCGKQAALTEEHAPSKAAGNAGPMIGARIDDVATRDAGTLVWARDEDSSDGATFKTLCASCNNETGRRYNPSYVALVRACESLALPDAAGSLATVGVINRPLVAKQALVSLIATSQPGLTTKYPSLRQLLMRSVARGSLAPWRLWCHLMANQVAMYTGIAVTVDRQRRAGGLVASVAYWPLGWLLTTGDVTVEGAADVSGWLELGKHTTPVPIELPCQWRFTQYPTDFRSPAEVLRESGPGHAGQTHR